MKQSLRLRASRLRREWKRRKRNRRNAARKEFRDFDSADRELIRRVSPYTQTSWQKIHGLLRATEYVVQHSIPGDLVECGVWRGGSVMAMALTLLRLGVKDRGLHLYDTFAGMTEPTAADVYHDGEPAHARWERQRNEDGSNDWCRAGLDEVRAAVTSTGYPVERVHCHVGPVEETLLTGAPDEISLLRLDTDWYESTRVEMEQLFPRLAPGGVIIIDDYGSWRGARRAVDEYLAEHKAPLLLNRLDAGARIGVKLPAGLSYRA